MEVATAATMTTAFGYRAFVQERVDSFEYKYARNSLQPDIIPINTLPIAKFQTLEATDIPLVEGKAVECTAHRLMQYQRKFAGDESIQLAQITWDTTRPGILSFAGIRPQSAEELENMGKVMSTHGYDREFREYAHYYNHIRKGYVSIESMIGFQYPHGTIDYYMARHAAVREYWINGSPTMDTRLVFAYMAIGYQLRHNAMQTYLNLPTH